MKILFSGGGTLGPVTPLLAMMDMVRSAQSHVSFVWCATARGPERGLLEKQDVRVYTIPSGKLRRYWSLLNIVDVANIVRGFFVAFRILWKENPDVCVSAGGYVSVPVHAAAWLLGIPTWIHQQDVTVGLANRLMAPGARLITTALKQSILHFPAQKTRWLGNPIRPDVLSGSASSAMKLFALDPALPVVFATGGGTGSLRLNQLIVEATEHLRGVCSVVHVSGKERPQEAIERAVRVYPHYRGYQFFTTEMKDAYAVADVVVSRGGFGTLTELAALKKAALILPKPGHQEKNIQFATEAQAVIAFDERFATGMQLAQTIKELLLNKTKQRALGEALHTLLPPANPDIVVRTLIELTKRS